MEGNSFEKDAPEVNAEEILLAPAGQGYTDKVCLPTVGFPPARYRA